MLIWLAEECQYLVASGDEHAVSDDEDAGICPATIETVLGVCGTRRDAERCVARRIGCLGLPARQQPAWPFVWARTLHWQVLNDCGVELWSRAGPPQYCWTVRAWVLDRGPAMLAEVVQSAWWCAPPLESAEPS
jgi:hypothetical protein